MRTPKLRIPSYGCEKEAVTLYTGSKRDISRLVSWSEIKERLEPEFDEIYAGFCFIAYKSYAATEEDHSAMRKKVEKAEKKLQKLKQECEAKQRIESEIFLCVLALMLRSTLAILLKEKAIALSVNILLKKLEYVKLIELNGKVMKESIE